MMSWPNLEWYVDRNRWYRMFSWQILSAMWIGKHVSGSFHDQFWSTIWIRSDDKGWCHDVIWGALWIDTNSGIMLSLPYMKCYVDWKIFDRKLSRPIWCTMWFRSSDRGWCHDVTLKSYVDMKLWYRMLYWPSIYIAMGIGNNVRGIFHDQFEVPCGF
jgi:hypothetical protein